LGVTLDEELEWKNHIDIFYGKLSKFVGIFYKLRNKLPSFTLQTIYYAFFHPNILYGIEIYANTHFTYLEKLAKLNNKISRILQFKPLSKPIAELYLTHNTLPRMELHKMQLLILAHKYLFHRSTLPEAYSEYFIANANIHNYNTRCKDDFNFNSCRLSYGCIQCKAASLWNTLPVEFKNDISVNMFKKKLSLFGVTVQRWI
jgi:hypothetical protein